MISTLVQLIVIMPYNHSYDRQLLIPASFECFSLSQLHRVDRGNGPASTDTDTDTHTHTHTSCRVIIWFSLFVLMFVLLPNFITVFHWPLPSWYCLSFLAWLALNVFYWPYKWERNSCPRISGMAKHMAPDTGKAYNVDLISGLRPQLSHL